MVNGSRLMAHGLCLKGARGPFEPRAMIHEPLTVDNRLINELFDYILQVSAIGHSRLRQPNWPCHQNVFGAWFLRALQGFNHARRARHIFLMDFALVDDDFLT